MQLAAVTRLCDATKPRYRDAMAIGFGEIRTRSVSVALAACFLAAPALGQDLPRGNTPRDAIEIPRDGVVTPRTPTSPQTDLAKRCDGVPATPRKCVFRFSGSQLF